MCVQLFAIAKLLVTVSSHRNCGIHTGGSDRPSPQQPIAQPHYESQWEIRPGTETTEVGATASTSFCCIFLFLCDRIYVSVLGFKWNAFVGNLENALNALRSALPMQIVRVNRAVGSCLASMLVCILFVSLRSFVICFHLLGMCGKQTFGSDSVLKKPNRSKSWHPFRVGQFSDRNCMQSAIQMVWYVIVVFNVPLDTL